jgi:predicted DNA-binding transcriptional regulator AlpA
MTVEEMVPRPKVAKELSLSSRTISRYEAEKRPGFDRPVKIGGRVFHPRSRIEAVKALGNLLQPAV